MAKVAGRNADLWVNGIATETDGNRITLTISPDTYEATAFASTGKEYVEGFYDWTLDFDGFWNSAATMNDSTFYQLIGQGAKEIKFFPDGSASAKVYYWGSAILKTYNPESTVAGPVTVRASLQGNGALSRGTAA